MRSGWRLSCWAFSYAMLLDSWRHACCLLCCHVASAGVAAATMLLVHGIAQEEQDAAETVRLRMQLLEAKAMPLAPPGENVYHQPCMTVIWHTISTSFVRAPGGLASLLADAATASAHPHLQTNDALRLPQLCLCWSETSLDNRLQQTAESRMAESAVELVIGATSRRKQSSAQSYM